MKIAPRIVGKVTVLDMEGKLDATSTPVLKDAVKGLIAEGKTLLVLNLTKVPFVNSTGLGTMVSILKELRAVKGVVKLYKLQPYVNELFEVTQLVKVFEIFADEESAIQSFDR